MSSGDARHTRKNGNRLSRIRLVPCRCSGHADGEPSIRFNATSSSLEKSAAARGLRSAYHAAAASASARAPGRNSTGAATTARGRSDTSTNHRQWDRLDLTGVEFGKSAPDLLGPRLADAWIGAFVIKAFDQLGGEIGTRLGRKSHGGFEKCLGGARHAQTLTHPEEEAGAPGAVVHRRDPRWRVDSTEARDEPPEGGQPTCAVRPRRA